MLKTIRLLAAGLLVTSTVGALGVAGPTATEQASAACVTAPTWNPTTTRFGISLSGSSGSSVTDDLAAEERRFGTRVNAVRTWDSTIPTGDVWAKRTAGFGSRYVVTSIRAKPQDVIAGRYDSQLRSYFSSAPTTMPIFWNYFHEPEDEVKAGQFTAAQFVQAHKRIADIAGSYCRSNLYPTLVLMGWTAMPASKLDWTDYYPGSGYVSVLGWDPYNGAQGDATSYRSPATLFDAVVGKSRAAGKPFGIAETGTARIPGDSSGTGRAAWLKQVESYMEANRAVFVTYFQSTNNGDFELRDAPGVAAWKAAMQ